jgi:hypothetical protein
MNVPAGWKAVENDEQLAAKAIGSDYLKSGKKASDQALERATNAETVILFYSKKPFGSIENSMFAIGATKQPSERVTPKMAAEASKSVLLTSPKATLTRDVSIEKISGRTFATFELAFDVNSQKIRMIYYVTMIRDYSLAVGLAYFDDASLRTMDASFRTIKFTGK